ncbi:MAG: hypothetical protein CFE24_02205 [Flavobacterium sp. BFFFF2]|nr:MAG: hypothetical protein CFE24_02205 [Flavobacterium sp. BFFFF2]
MTFFTAQKTLMTLWFLWTGVIVLFLFNEILGDFKPISAMVIKWVALYLGPVFSLMFSSSFFKREWFQEELKSTLFLYVALGASILYLAIISYCLFAVPSTIPSIDLNGKTPAVLLNEAFESEGQLLTFMEPIVAGVLGYFFFSNKKGSTAA